jgi:HK97 family phage major capsid protein/HK97 family phage prohead protease
MAKSIQTNRAYSILNVKRVEEKDELRLIQGTATTPTPDRIGDIVEPLGIKFKNPLKLLWQHDHKAPVGTVMFKTPTANGIDFEARIAKTDKPGRVKDRLDEAWDSVGLGLVSAVSIGFKAIDFEFMKDGDGIRFKETEVIELSLVTIPANSECNISTIKSLDSEALTASGHYDAACERPVRPGVTGKRKTSTKLELKMPTTITEQISGAEAKRAAHSARMDAIMAKAAEEGRVLETAEEEEYDGLKQDVQNLDNHLVRLRDHHERIKAAAQPAGEENNVTVTINDRTGNGSAGVPALREHQTHLQNGVHVPRVKFMEAKYENWQPFTRYVQAIAAGRGDLTRTREWVAKQPWLDQTPMVQRMVELDPRDIASQLQLRAVVGVGDTVNTTWASPLIAYTQAASLFAEYLRPSTIIGRLTGLRNVPFNVQIPRMTTGASVNWVGENAPKPVTSEAFDTITMRWAKAAAIIAITQELARFSNPQAEGLIREDLRRAMTEFLDRQFIDPSVAAVTNVSPASVLNGVTAVTPTGTTASAFRADVKTLLAPLLTANIPIESGVWVMHTSQALSLSLMANSLGQPVFPGMTRDGGTLLGFPVVASTNIPAAGGSPADGYVLAFLVQNEIMLSDDGQTIIDASDQASIQMDSAPDSPPSASSAYVSLWQMNWVGLRVERWINWLKRRSQAAQYMQGAKYAE